jgi:Putative transposase
VIFEPLDFLSRLAALVPSPGVNLTRYHGVFAANHRLRAQIVPGKRGRGGSGEGQGSAVPQRHAMTWAQRLKRVFGIEIESCDQCGGAVKIIASIEDPQVIGRILEHLGLDGSGAPSHQLPRHAHRRSDPPVYSIDLRCCAGRLMVRSGWDLCSLIPSPLCAAPSLLCSGALQSP